MRIEQVALTESDDVFAGTLNAITAQDEDGNPCPAYKLQIFLQKPYMTFDELTRCIKSIDEFLNGILLFCGDDEKPIFIHPCIQQFEDAFKPETE